MTKIEKVTQDLEELRTEDNDASIEYAQDALSFVQALNDMFLQNGAALSEDVDFDSLQNVIDAHIGELAAAILLLKGLRDNFPVVQVLEQISKSLEESDVVPSVLRKGYLRVARRLQVPDNPVSVVVE